ncbi:hypothetical protein [Petrachloros mirabilis]
MPLTWTLQLNAVLGSIVVAIGAMLAWDRLPASGAAGVMVVAAAFLLWRGRTICRVWAWSTLLLGVESFAWPVITMAKIRSVTVQPTDEELGRILSAVLMGLFSAVFWMAFSYGLFKRVRAQEGPPESQVMKKSSPTAQPFPSPRRRKKR